MSVIAGVTVTWTDYSAPGTPRIINIPDVAGDVTVEDLWDTCSEISAEENNLQYAKLIDRPKGGGRGVLSVTKSVGISMVLNNAQVKFFDQPGPAWVIKRVVDGNLTAIDHLGAALEALANSDFTNWKNEADVSAAIITVDTPLTIQQSADLEDIKRAHFNRRKLDKGALTETLYADDGTTPYVVFDVNIDLATEGLTELTPQ